MADENHSDPSYSASSDDESDDENDEVDRDEVKEVRKLSSKDTTPNPLLALCRHCGIVVDSICCHVCNLHIFGAARIRELRDSGKH
jgi:hypothetical protein